MGGTDCALPMLWAARNKLNVSAFMTYTDSETWAGNIHPAQALRQYRSEFVGDAKAVVVGMTSNGFTLADPNDRGMLDVVGFDTTRAGGHRGLCSVVTAERFKDARSKQAGGGESFRPHFNFNPVGRTAQAAVCKAAEAGAIPARDSISEHRC